MKNEDISQKKIRNYLIGNLDEATTETLDELSIADQEFADRIAAEQYELVDDWVAGRLDPTERGLFGTVLARSPTLIEKVKVSQLMAATPRVAVVERPATQSFLSRLFSGLPRFAYGFAGLVLLVGVVSAIVFIFRNDDAPQLSRVDTPVNGSAADLPIANDPPPSPNTPTAQTSPLAANAYRPIKSPSPEPTRPASRSFVALALAPPTRGSGEIRSVKIDPGVEYLELNIETEAATEGGRFLVEIGDPTGKSTWRSGSTAARSRHGRSMISVRAPAIKIGNGTLTVRLLRSDMEVVDEHIIRIDR